MANGLIPRDFFTFPNLRMPSLMTDFLDETVMDAIPSGLSVAEDEKHVYVEAALPGLDAKDIEVAFEKGVLYIRGEMKEEKETKKYYKKATKSFAYQALIPTEVVQGATPSATFKNGVMTVTFKKAAPSKPKRIEVKAT